MPKRIQSVFADPLRFINSSKAFFIVSIFESSNWEASPPSEQQFARRACNQIHSHQRLVPCMCTGIVVLTYLPVSDPAACHCPSSCYTFVFHVIYTIVLHFKCSCWAQDLTNKENVLVKQSFFSACHFQLRELKCCLQLLGVSYPISLNETQASSNHTLVNVQSLCLGRVKRKLHKINMLNL